MRRILFVVLMLITVTVYAVVSDRTITFVPPTEYADDTALAPIDIDHYNVYCGPSAGAYDSIPVSTIIAPATAATIQLYRTVDWHCAMTTVLVSAQDSLESDLSVDVMVPKKFIAAKAPTSLQVAD